MKKNININITPAEIRKIMADYEYQEDIFTEESPKIRNLKWAISQLPTAERIIFILWVDLQSSRKVADILGVSHNLILGEVKRIKHIIQNILCSENLL